MVYLVKLIKYVIDYWIHQGRAVVIQKQIDNFTNNLANKCAGKMFSL